jgi:hypothetical protein
LLDPKLKWPISCDTSFRDAWDKRYSDFKEQKGCLLSLYGVSSMVCPTEPCHFVGDFWTH